MTTTEKTETKNIRAVLIITGSSVINVGFRVYIQKKANELGVKGKVKNVPSGAPDVVQAVIEGEEARVEELIKLARIGPSAAKITKVHSFYKPYQGEFTDFSIVD